MPDPRIKLLDPTPTEDELQYSSYVFGLPASDRTVGNLAEVFAQRRIAVAREALEWAIGHLTSRRISISHPREIAGYLTAMLYLHETLAAHNAACAERLVPSGAEGSRGAMKEREHEEADCG